MSPTVSQLVADKTDQIDCDQVAEKYPWLFEQNLDCILSPDCDGLLCGLFMSHTLNWKIRGFYDGKILVHHKDVSPQSCVYLDMEIFRPNIRSLGQHMLLYNRNQKPENWNQFDDCFSINNFRNHDGLHDFRLKYPFGTIHFLLVALHQQCSVEIPDSAIIPLLFTDGTYHNLFRYTENSLNWLHYLRSQEKDNPLFTFFMKNKYSLDQLMKGMNEFWRARDEISTIPGERGDRVAISPRGNSTDPENLEDCGEFHRFKDDPRDRAETFIRLLQERTGWRYTPENWSWDQWNILRFSKESFQTTGQRLNGASFQQLMANNPLSFAMTSGLNIEYTLAQPDSL